MTILDPEQTFASLSDAVGLDVRLKKAVARLGHSRPTLVQSKCLPLAISSGRDLLIRAKTGSGKTLGYLLPTLHKILSKKSSSGGIEAVIMVPTRELCHQVQKTIESLSYYCDDAITVAVLSIGKVRGSKSRSQRQRTKWTKMGHKRFDWHQQQRNISPLYFQSSSDQLAILPSLDYPTPNIHALQTTTQQSPVAPSTTAKGSNLFIMIRVLLVGLAFIVVPYASAVSSAVPLPQIRSSIREYTLNGPPLVGEFVADEVPGFSTQIAADQFIDMEGGMQMETAEGSETVGWLEPGDWVAYAVALPVTGTYEIELSIASPEGDGAFELVNQDTNEVYSTFDKLPETGDYETLKTVRREVELPKGELTLQIRSKESGWNMQWISLKLIIDLNEDEAPTKAPTKEKSPKTKSPTATPTQSPTHNPTKTPINNPTKSPTNVPTKSPVSDPTKSPVKQKKPPKQQDAKPTSAPSRAPTKAPVRAPKPAPQRSPPTSAPSDAPVKTPVKEREPNAPVKPPVKEREPDAPVKAPIKELNRPTRAPVKPPVKEREPDAPVKAPVKEREPDRPTKAPVRKEEPESNATPSKPTSAPTSLTANEVDVYSITFDATDYSYKEGVEMDVEMMNAGNWVAYPLQLPVSGRYAVKMRISSPKGEGAFEMMNYETQETFAAYDDLPATGNWMTWRTVTRFVDLPRGSFDLQILATEPGWSLLWLKIEEVPTFTESETDPTGFVRAYEQIIVDPEGFAVQFKGISLGGWMVQEPDMMLADEFAKSPSEYHQKLKNIVGAENHAKFKQRWLDNFVSRQDIKEMKSIGFNLVRVPMHYELFTLSVEDEPIKGLTSWVGTGFKLLDDLLSWCAEEGVYVILDLQAAPGGQSREMSITDYNASRPALFESPDNQYKTLVLWQALAYRYSENPWIAGYELLSAVNWTFSNDTNATCLEEDNAELKSFYMQAIDAIRAVDQNHMIVINGNCGGSHHTGLWPMDDKNLVLGFQDEGEANFTDQLLLFTNYSESYDVPLFFKPGAYDDTWNAEAVEELEKTQTSWSWWTWKMLDSSASAFSVSATDLYKDLVNHLAAAAPSTDIFAEVLALNATTQTNSTYKAEEGVLALMSLANNTNLTQCTRNPSFLGSLLGGGGSGCDTAAVIYVDPTQPSRVARDEYCSLQQVGVIEEESWLNQGDSASYKVEIGSTGTYEFLFKVSSMDGSGGLELLSNGVSLTRIDTLPLTTRRDEWTYVYANAALTQGTQQLEIVSTEAGWTMEWFQVLLVQ
ncbi:hypothetical protein FisN_32Lh014 [Fistulifera solaris]|uniref:CBM6 domain-containing protein n=1 Tax=Fistulifera solaris TaxID=1519565 RepID=A0A1Z5KNW5_FISSO|nr:hypothetical protein FisN_32Lh014 [Fistulifera solaris]|eukprot:GAX27966.1 hypothetical protein FisN_32Lh014 [Fistulifera solaris]